VGDRFHPGRGQERADLPFQPFVIASTWLGLLIPTVVITRLVDGPAGVHELRRRVLKMRASVGWYALALLALPETLREFPQGAIP